MIDNRRIRIFLSSTFRDMDAERKQLLTHTWPELRRFCRERQVELVEVDMRWGIPDEQSDRKETLKLCLDEIRLCRPYFIGLLGERYGWTPGEDAFTADLKEEQPWLKGLSGKSVTEMEILHGVLNHPELARRSFFYFRDPAYARESGPDFMPENAEAADKQAALKEAIRRTCKAEEIPLREDYPDPESLAALLRADLEAAIEAEFPIEEIEDALTREARDHEAFAELRRRTYIGRPEYFLRLDEHVASDGGPLVLLGEPGSGKSSLLANWISHWRNEHPGDFVFQHYIGGTSDSAGHVRLMVRLIAQIKRWADDPDEFPRSEEELLRDFPVWLAKARIKAERDGVRFIIVLDALNQLEDRGHSRALGWLTSHPFAGPLRLIVSTLPGDTLSRLEEREWKSLTIEPLTAEERRQMIAEYLNRFGKRLDRSRLDRIAAAPPAANPLYLKILLDELRVTGTHERLDERLDDYLSAPTIPALLKKVLARYERDYERGGRTGLVSEALGLIWAARRGLTEVELRQLLRPEDLPLLPFAVWSPLRAALEESLVDRGGILNFAHEFLQSAVEDAFVKDEDRRQMLRLRLANYFEQQPVSARSSDELPWLLWQTKSMLRLRICLLDIERFLMIQARDEEELRRYWVDLGEERFMGNGYVSSFDVWLRRDLPDPSLASRAADVLCRFLYDAALYVDAEPLMRKALEADEDFYGRDHLKIATRLNGLGLLLKDTNQVAEAEGVFRRAIAIGESADPVDNPIVATGINNLAILFDDSGRFEEAEPLYRRALAIFEKYDGPDRPSVATTINNLAQVLQAVNRLDEAEELMRRALSIDQRCHGPEHPDVARDLHNLAALLQRTRRTEEAESLMRQALAIDERSYGKDHPNVATDLNNLARLLKDTNRLAEAEVLFRRALAINEHCHGAVHSSVAKSLNNLAELLKDTERIEEAEVLYRRALDINEHCEGPYHPAVSAGLDTLIGMMKDVNRLEDAEPLMRRRLAISEHVDGPDDPQLAIEINNFAQVLHAIGKVGEAESLFRRALAICEKCHGPAHITVGTCLNNLGNLLRDTGRREEAEPLIRNALMICEEHYGTYHPIVAAGLNNLGLLLADLGRLEEAEPMLRLNLIIFVELMRSTGQAPAQLQMSIHNYGGLLTEMGCGEYQILGILSDIAPELYR